MGSVHPSGSLFGISCVPSCKNTVPALQGLSVGFAVKQVNRHACARVGGAQGRQWGREGAPRAERMPAETKGRIRGGGRAEGEMWPGSPGRRGRRGVSGDPTPSPAPLLGAKAGPAARPGRGDASPPARIRTLGGPQHPTPGPQTFPPGLLQTRRAGPDPPVPTRPHPSPPVSTTRRARPLTFTFPASRRPSCPQRHQQAPARGEAGGGGRTRGSPAAAGWPLWPGGVVGLQAQLIGPHHSLGVRGASA